MALAIGFAMMATLGFGSGAIFIRLATQRLSTPTVTFFVVGVGAIIAVSLALAFNLPEMKSQSASALVWFCILAALGYPIARLLHYTAISLAGATRVAPIAAMSPVFAVCLAIAVLGERPNPLVGLGTPAIVVGLVLVVKAVGRSAGTGNSVGINKTGYLLEFAAALTFGVRAAISKHVVTDVASPLVASAFALSIGAAMLLVIYHRDVLRSIRRTSMKYIVGICALAGISEGLASIFVFQALNMAPLTVVNPISHSTPLVVLGLSFFFLKRLEQITPALVVGTILSLAGIIIIIIGAGS